MFGNIVGGESSPLLANIALHGMETFLQSQFPRKRRIPGEEVARITWQPQVVRYADDFVILHPDPAVIEQTQKLIEQWLQPLGLELQKEKTRISHTLWYGNEPSGFDFLGFHIQQHKAAKNRRPAAKLHRLEYTTKVTPSKQALKTQGQKLRQTIRKMRVKNQAELILALNPLIAGWGRYFGICHSESKNSLDHQLLYFGLKRWARRRHPMKHWGWVARKYWRLETGKWTFGTPTGIDLQTHYQKMERLKPVGERSPFDGDWAYWLMRGKQHPDLSPTKGKLYRKQGGKCIECGLQFQAGDKLEVDHIIPRSQGGSNAYYNKQLLHRHCHDEKTLCDQHGEGGINDH